MIQAERHPLRSFYRFDLCEETSYDLLIYFYRDMGFASRETYWMQTGWSCLKQGEA